MPSLQKDYRPVRMLAWLVVGLVATAGVFAGLNTMYASVLGRIPELATLQTIGFLRRAIVLSLIQEGVVLAATACLLATLLAVSGMHGVSVRFTMGAFALQIDRWSVLVGCGVGLGLGVCGAIPPAVLACACRWLKRYEPFERKPTMTTKFRFSGAILLIVSGLSGCGTAPPSMCPPCRPRRRAATADGRIPAGHRTGRWPVRAAACASVQDGAVIVVLGRIGGSATPWVAGGRRFRSSIPSGPCNECAGDNCPTPWDYCCDTDQLPTAKALIKFVDAAGQLVAVDARNSCSSRNCRPWSSKAPRSGTRPAT